MRLIDKINASGNNPFYTFEFFPPRTDQGFSNLLSRISRLAELKPSAISITWGAGGSTRDRTLELASVTQRDYGVDTIMHVTCTNMEQGMVDDALRAAKRIGIENILALRGDPPRGEEEWTPVDQRFTHAVDLVSYIRSTPEFADSFCIGVAAYPDGHTDKEYSEDEEIDHLKAKVDAGADFIVTQLFYDVDNYMRWLGKVRQRGIAVPVIPGIMPLQTYSSFLRLTKLCGTHIPPEIQAELEPIKHDDQKVKDYGVSLSVRLIKRLVNEGGVTGFHFSTLNLEKSVQRILEGLDWAHKGPSKFQNWLIAETPGPIVHPPEPKSEFVVTPANASDYATSGLNSHLPKEGEVGKGEVNNAATWDEFPNGRFGDVNSPAFGTQDLWGGYSRLRNEASQWARPTSPADITSICLRFLTFHASSWPFSPSPLSSESQLILPHLKRLAHLGWWPVGSQPAVDGARSEDETVGWGPRSGYVYQKAFVEFFVGEEEVRRLEGRVRERGKGEVDLLACNLKDDLRTNVAEGERNAVTWGVFPGQEIVQSTIIERESFLSWKDEAFSIWTDWASLYPPGSKERELLEGIRDTRYLVNVTHHDFKNPDALWNFLFEDLPVEPEAAVGER